MRSIRMISGLLILVAFSVISLPRAAFAQADPDFEIGLKPFGSYSGGNIDTVNLFSGMLNLDFPLMSYPQRGGKLKLDFHFRMTSFSYYYTVDSFTCPDGQNTCYSTDWESPNSGGGFTQEGVPIATPTSQNDGQGGCPCYWWASVTTPDQAVHQMALTALSNGTWRAADATGYAVAGPPNSTNYYPNDFSGPVIDSNGLRYSPAQGAAYIPYGWQAASVEDTNGNQIIVSSNGAVTQWQDSMGRAIPAPAPTSDYDRCPNSSGTTSAVLWNFPGVNSGSYPILLCYGGTVSYGYDEFNTEYGYWQVISGNAPMLQYLVLPDNSYWSFQYTTDGNANPAKITFPTGGALCYWWATQTSGSQDGPEYQVTPRVTAREVDATGSCDPNSPPSTPHWTYDYEGETTNVTDPAGNTTTHKFSVIPGQAEQYEVETDYPGQTVYNQYAPAGSCADQDGGVLMKTNTQLDNGQEDEIDYAYDGGFSAGEPWQDTSPIELSAGSCVYGEQTSKQVYDYGPGSPGAYLGPTDTSYAFQDSSSYPNYLAANLLSLPESVQLNGALTSYSYDESNCASAACGNLTSIHKWVSDSATATPTCGVSVTNGSVVTYMTYNSDGTLASSVDNCGSSPSDSSHMTGYAYSSACFAGSGPTSVTNPLGQMTSYCYDSNTGLQTSVTDPNSQTTGTTYDDALRTTEIDYPDGGKTQFAYPSTNEVQICKYMSPTASDASACTGAGGTWKNTNLIVDGLGRLSQTQLTSVPSTISTLTTYDAMGRRYQVYNPTSCSPITTSCGESTWGYTQYQYDALSRPIQVTQPDGSTILTSYTGRATQVQDEGNGTTRSTRVSQADALGRLTSVCEVSGTTQLGSGSTPASCGQDIAATGFLTNYAYDSLSNLISVNQGPLQRSFTYDSLSRLISSTNPESNWSSSAQQFVPTTYAYDANGNLITKTSPLPNQTGTATLTTTYAYDALNRLTSKSYSDGTPTAQFVYDGSGNGIGRLTQADISGCNFSIYSYDGMGRQVYSDQKTPMLCTPGAGFQLYAAYDLIGDLTSISDGWSQGHINYTYDTAGRPTSGGWSIDSTGLANPFISGIQYDPEDHVVSDTLGDGEIEMFAYNNRGWQQSSLAQYQSNEWYGFNVSNFAPNGDILAASDTANGNWTYSYDEFNRLLGSNQNNGAAVYSYSYDRFGNRWQQNGPQTMSLSFSANNNRMDGYTYDTAGNLLNDGSHSYTYDAENRLIQVDGGSTATYIYDANGRRIENTGDYNYTPTGVVDYVYDLQGRLFFHAWENPGPSMDCCFYDFYLGDRHVYYSDQKFSHTDWLGTERFRGSTTKPSDYCASLPFGDALSCSNSADENDESSLHFTGQFHDWESGLDYFGARFYSSQLGRFVSINPTDGRPAFPQSWNAYAYVLNNPLIAVDPNGLDCVYLNDAGDGIDPNGIDSNSNPIECQKNGGVWADGTITNVNFDPSSNDVLLGYANMGDNGNVDYSQITATPGQFNSGDEIYGIADDINQMNLEANTFKIYGLGAAVGATGGTACYVFCGQLGIGTITTLGATAATAGPAAQNPQLQNFINMLFKSSDELPGGTAGAVRYELRTGELLSNSGHSIKAQQIINGLQNLINKGTLSQTDTATAKSLIQDLKDALSTKPW